LSKQTGDTKGSLSTLREFAFSSLVTKALSILVRVGKNVLFTRLLGPEGRGVYGLLMNTPTLVVSFGNLGFGLGLFYLAAKKKGDLRTLIGNALLYAVIHGAILYLVGVFLFHLQDLGYFPMDGSATIRPYVLAAIPLLLLYNLSLDLFVGAKAIHSMNVLSLFFSILPIIVMLLLYSLTGDVLSAALYSWVLTLGVIGVVSFGRLLKLAGGWPKLSMPLAVQAFQFGVRGCGSQFTDSIVRRVDLLFLAHYWSAAEVGQYAVATSVAEILLALPESVSTPFMSLRLGMEDGEGKHFSSLVIKYVLFIMFTICLLTGIAAWPLIMLLFGRPFLPSLWPFFWLLPGIMGLSLYPFLKTDVLGVGRPGLLSQVSTVTMFVNLALNFLLIPRFGASGAAISSSASYLLSSLVLLVFVAKKSGLPAREILFMRSADFSMIKDLFRSKFLGKRR